MKNDETSYLLKSPENASRLLKGIEDYENGLGKEQQLVATDTINDEKLGSLTTQDYHEHFVRNVKTKSNQQ